jgi:hypothetical protein
LKKNEKKLGFSSILVDAFQCLLGSVEEGEDRSNSEVRVRVCEGNVDGEAALYSAKRREPRQLLDGIVYHIVCLGSCASMKHITAVNKVGFSGSHYEIRFITVWILLSLRSAVWAGVDLMNFLFFLF